MFVLLPAMGAIGSASIAYSALFVHLHKVILIADNLGICLFKDKCKPQYIKVLNFLSGKAELVNLDELAAR